MKLILVLALGLATTAAQARTVALYGDHAVCEETDVTATLTDTSIGRKAWDKLLNAEIKRGRCVVVKKGTEVEIDGQDGMFTCIRLVGGKICGWTVMHPDQLR